MYILIICVDLLSPGLYLQIHANSLLSKLKKNLVHALESKAIYFFFLILKQKLLSQTNTYIKDM